MGNKKEPDRAEKQEYLKESSFIRKTGKQRERILAAAGKLPPDLIFKNAGIVNVFTGETERGDIAIYDGIIVGIGDYASLEYKGESAVMADDPQENREGKEVLDKFKTYRTGSNSHKTSVTKIIDCSGRIVCPGFIDGHIHIESSMLSPAEFAAAVVPHGTGAVITDPHEIVNVAGLSGLDYMLEASENLPLDVFFMLPSCVPATSLDESGAVLKARDLAAYMEHDRVLGLAELMDFYGTACGREDIVAKTVLTKHYNKRIDGHAPGLRSYDLNAYITAGAASDHECSDISEALEKLRRGQWIMIREGTAARNMEALMPLFERPYCERCMLVTDDKHPGDLLRQGHVDYLIRKAVEYGADPVTAIRMATINPARYFGLAGMGAIAPGYRADLVILEDLKTLTVEEVYKGGKLAACQGKYEKPVPGGRYVDSMKVCPGRTEGKNTAEAAGGDYPGKIYTSFHLKELVPEDFTVRESGSFVRVIELVPGELLTKEVVLPYRELELQAGGKVCEDIIRLAVAERHHNTGNIGLGYLKGYGLKSGAIASSIAHDSHNLIIAGTGKEDMCLAANRVRENQGGLALVQNGKLLGELALPIAGLMCEESAEQTDRILAFLKSEAGRLGVKKGIDPFMTLAFLSLPVIPEIRLTTWGPVDVKSQSIVKTCFS